jgi:hypothetical protein
MTAIAAMLWALLAAGAEAQPSASRESSAQERERQADVARLAPATAKMFQLLGGASSAKADLQEGPLLRWSNPTAGSVYGEVFLWTIDQRPVAAASIYRWYHPYRDATVEFTSTSEQPIFAKEGDKVVWDAQTPGVMFKLLADAPQPAETPVRRLSQMKALARDFSAELKDQRGGEAVDRQLRLLNQPVYRYATPGQAVIDGALFAFVEGTDPEAWLLVETIQQKDGRQWRYALVRMNSDALSVRRKGVVVQSWQAIRQAWRNRQATYTFFSFDPAMVKMQPSKEAP